MAVGWRVRSLIQTADSLEPADRMVTHACDVHDAAFSPQGGHTMETNAVQPFRIRAAWQAVGGNSV